MPSSRSRWSERRLGDSHLAVPLGTLVAADHVVNHLVEELAELVFQFAFSVEFHGGLANSLVAGVGNDQVLQHLDIAHGFVQRNALFKPQLAKTLIATGNLAVVCVTQPVPKMPQNVGRPTAELRLG